MDNEDWVYVYVTVFFVNHKKKEWNSAICTTWMDLESITLNEMSQMEKDKRQRQNMILSYTESKKKISENTMNK